MSKKIEAKVVKEPEETCPEGETWNSEAGKCMPKPKEDYTNPDSTILSATAMLDPVRPPTPPATTTTVLGTPAAPDGNFMQSGPEYAHKGAPPNISATQETTQKEASEPERITKPSTVYAPSGPASDTDMPKPEDIRSGPTRTSQPGRILLKTTIGGEVEEPSSLPSPTGQPVHVVVGTAPVETMTTELLNEQVERIKAETREATAHDETEKIKETMKKVEAIWANKYITLSEGYRKQQAYSQSQEQILKEQREAFHNEQLRSEDLRVEMRDIKNQFADATSISNKQAHLIEDLKIENAELNKKYHGALQTNLELSKKVTASNEDYLELAKQKEKVEEKLTQARTNAKKTLKLQI